MRSLASAVVRTAAGRRLVRAMGTARTREVLADIVPLLRPGDRLLDIGAGSCDVAAALMANGVPTEPCDVIDLSCVPGVHPTLFDGRRLPYADDAFDVALLVTVLHHVTDPDALLSEARRVAQRVVVQEDVFRSAAQKYATFLMDSVANLEFLGHPHSNRNDAGWRAAFRRGGLRLLRATTKRYWGLFASATYLLERSATPSVADR